MQCLKNIFRRKNAGLSSNSPEFEETDFFRSISFKDYFEEVDLHEEATMTQKPPNQNNVIENETDEMKKTSQEKVNRHEESPGNYWTGNYDEGKNKMQKEESLNSAWCGASNFDKKPTCEWSWRENGGLFGGGSNGVGRMRSFWQS